MDFAEKKFRKISKLYCLFQASIGLLLWVPIFYNYQISHGLSDFEYFQIQSLYYIIFCFLELPTGYLSDRWGHRKTLIGSAALMMLSNFLAIFTPNYWGFLLHFIVIAFSRALMSGAASAYLFESLNENGKGSEYKKVEGRARSYLLFSRVLGWAAVGKMTLINEDAAYWGTAFFCGVATLAAFLLPQLEIKQKTESKTGVLESARIIFKSLSEKRTLLWLIGLGSGVFVLTRLTQVNLFQPILEKKGFSLEYFGWIMAGLTLMEAIGTSQSFRLSRRFSDLSLAKWMTVCACLSLLFISFGGREFTLLGFLLFTFFSGLVYPSLKELVNRSIPDSRFRATFLSFESISYRSICALMALTSGYFVEQGLIWKYLATLSLAFAFFIFLVGWVLQRRPDLKHG